jgi:hypothetical protein
LELKAVRADRISEPGNITLQILDQVLNAKAAIADLTELNPNVFYELAVRHTVRRPVALIAEKGTDLPFDISPMRVIKFDHRDLRSAAECKKEIVAHLRHALSNDEADSPISTAVDVASLQSGSAVERNVAELANGIQDLARMQRDMLRDMRGCTGPEFLFSRRRGLESWWAPTHSIDDLVTRLDKLDWESMPAEIRAEELLRIKETLRLMSNLSERARMRHYVGAEPGVTEKEERKEGGDPSPE